MATAFICVTCGTQFAPAEREPDRCPVCEDERQYVGPGGQKWTSLRDLQGQHRNTISEAEPGLHVIQPEPKAGIGQRAFLVRTPVGNLLWDCVPLLDDTTVARVTALGGLAGIAISHPHYYSAMVEWSRAFGGVPIHLHRADAEWVMRPDDAVRFWDGERRPLFGGLELVHLGGHFPGFQGLHWPAGADGGGAVLVGDQPFVVTDRRWVSFMYSYPNLIPLPSGDVRRIARTLTGLAFDRLYGAFAGQVIEFGAREVVARSAERYLRFVAGDDRG